SPERVSRHVLRAVLHALTGGQAVAPNRTPLYGLITAALKSELASANGAPATWEQVEAAHGRLVARLAATDPSRGVLFDRTVYDVLFRYFREAHPSGQAAGAPVGPSAVRWLSGEALEPAEARRLGLPAQADPTRPVALADNQHVKQVLVALTQ